MVKAYRQIPLEDGKLPDSVLPQEYTPTPAYPDNMVFAARGVVTYEDTTATELFTLPAGAVIDALTINVTAGFNDDSSAILDIGIDGEVDKFAADVDVSSEGIQTTGIVAAEIGAVQASETVVTAIYTGGEGDANAGEAVVICLYHVPPTEE